MQSTDTSSRQRLVDAMASLLWEKGYAATSPRDVMAAAKVGQGSFYYHFSGKHELAVAALSQNISELLGQGADTASSSPLEKLKAYLVHPRPGLKGCRVGRMTQDPKVLQDPELLGMVEAAFRTAEQNWKHMIDAAITAGELPEGLDSQQLARTLAAVLQGGYVLSRAYGSQQPMDDAVHGMASMLDSLAHSQQPPRNPATGTTVTSTDDKEKL
ncbi:TetR/AcrR family transcriptional regulator [Ancrocorticia populi]|uniref:TetR/AcrR family transcriptional regulator n=1 Tax=Ancrocorticia populi TaxID=2175228 RepID=UPI003F9AA807